MTNQDSAVSLVKTPLSVSVSPDGKHAAVGHDALISYVNLVTGTVERTFVIPTSAANVVLAPAWVYVMPGYQANSVSVNLSSGAVTPNTSIYEGTGGGRLNQTTKAIYGTRDGTSPNDIERYDISTGPITKQTDSIYHGDYPVCGPVWISPDDSRIYSGCSTIFRASTDPKQDMYYYSVFPDTTSVSALADSIAATRIALIKNNSRSYPSDGVSDGLVFFFDRANLQPQKVYALPQFQANGNSYKAHGKSLFFNRVGTELYVIMQADSGSGMLNDYALERIPLTTPASCGAAFNSSAVHAPAVGVNGTVGITAATGCVYQAVSNTPWIQVVSGGYSSGNGTLNYTVLANPGTATRSGTINLGSHVLTVTQDAGVMIPGGDTSILAYTVAAAGYSKSLDRLILVSANPDQLHIYDPSAHTETAVPLSSAPLSISVRPDGEYAAVGHSGTMSLVNLKSASVEKVYSVVTDVAHVQLASNGYAYLFPARDWSDIYSLELATGTVTAVNAIYEGRVPAMTPDEQYLYLGGNWSSKWDISNGPLKAASNSLSNSLSCGNLWMDGSGQRLFTACGKAYLLSSVPAQDMQYNGTLSNASGVVWAANSPKNKKTAFIPKANSSSYGTLTSGDTSVQIYGDDYLTYLGSVGLPQFILNPFGGYPTVSYGVPSYVAHGTYVTWNAAETKLYVVEQADSSMGPLPIFAVATLAPGTTVNPTIQWIGNAASYAAGAIAPGELITIGGSGLSISSGISFTPGSDGKIPSILAGTEVYFNGIAAPILYAGSNQINTIVPYSLWNSTVTVQVRTQGILSDSATLTLASAAPSIFTRTASGKGQAAAVNLDGTLNSAAHPAKAGSYVSLYCTGGGATYPSGQTGTITPLSPLRTLQQKVTATVGGKAAEVSFAGSAPLQADGVNQINLKLAADTPKGAAQAVVITVGTVSSPGGVTLAVE